MCSPIGQPIAQAQALGAQMMDDPLDALRHGVVTRSQVAALLEEM